MTYDEMYEAGITENEIQQGEIQAMLEASGNEYETPVEPAFREYARDPELIECSDEECEANEGRINLKYEYDPEVGEQITEFRYCQCNRGQRTQEADEKYESDAAMAQEIRF